MELTPPPSLKQDRIFSTIAPLWYLEENRPLLRYTSAKYYLAYSLDSRLSVSANGHASHALWDVIWKSWVGYRGEAGPPTRQLDIHFAFYSNSANCHNKAYFVLISLT